VNTTNSQFIAHSREIGDCYRSVSVSKSTAPTSQSRDGGRSTSYRLAEPDETSQVSWWKPSLSRDSARRTTITLIGCFKIASRLENRLPGPRYTLDAFILMVPRAHHTRP